MTDGNAPAHPQHGFSSDPAVLERMKNQGGLTKREYFAAMAFTGMDIGSSTPESSAQWAVKYADALIAALNKPEAK